jgi:electron transfer flavoprotein alpha subunit
MNVLVFIDHAEGKIRKASLEAASYGATIADSKGGTALAIVLGQVSDDLSALGKQGINRVLTVDSGQPGDAQSSAAVLSEVVAKTGAELVIFPNTACGKALAPRLSVRLKAGLVSGAIAVPDMSSGFVVKKNVFSGKAFAHVAINTAIKIIALNPNTFPISQSGNSAVVEPMSVPVPPSRIKVLGTSKVEGEVSLTEAEIVVSGGRGLKGPENWGLVTELATLLGAATACSRPVADIHWRPHHEHVGQTGIAIAPNLYIAIGISGAIQHLAGVNRSKTIVVINKDPEAPFFKAADYGIVGDAFEVVPRMIAAVKKLKGVA